MSHFTVMVVGNDVARQLQPFHEFECTGTDDEFVQDIDETAEKREEFEKATRSMVRLADGTEICRFADACFRDPTPEEEKAIGPLADTGWAGGKFHTSKDWGDGRGYRAKIWALPEGVEEFEQPFASFADYLRYDCSGDYVVPHGEEPDLASRHKYGYAMQDEAGEIVKVVRRTNPNKQWDWWVIGGRWAGYFKLKPGAAGERGKNGLMGSCRNAGPGFADQARKGDIDFEAMRDEAGKVAGEKFDQVHAVIAGRDWQSWERVRTVQHVGDIDAARKAYNAQPVVSDLGASGLLGLFDDLERYRVTRDQFVATARDGAIATFAVVKDGQWFERGRMGWWCCVSDEKDPDSWAQQFAALVDGLPDDTLLTVVDCHI